MDIFLTVLLILAALILLYVLWCLAEPFFLVNDKVVLKKHEINKGTISKETISKLPFVPQGSSDAPDLRLFFFSDIHTEWCPVTAARMNKAIRKAHELILSSQDNLSPEQRNAYLSNIVRRSEQMERIVADIMELTRMESSDSDFHFTSVSISEMLDELVVMYSMDLEDTDKHLSLDLPPMDSLIVKADPAKFSRVFENLISNAINYTGPKANIVVKAWRSGDLSHISTQKIHISVSDDGIGIPEQDMPRIFDRFYRAHNSGINIKGTGLGLAIVKLICDKHDAEIKVTSKLGEGTTFEIIIGASY